MNSSSSSKTPGPGDPVLSWNDFNVARPSDKSVSQATFKMTKITVIHRPAENGGGIMLVIAAGGSRHEMVLDETARDHLVTLLSGPVVTPCRPVAR